MKDGLRHRCSSAEELMTTFAVRFQERQAATQRVFKKGAPTCAGAPSTVGALPGMCPNRSSGRNPLRSRPRENSHIVGALGMLGDVEAFAFGLDIGAQADDDIDDLVENCRTDPRPY